MSPFKTAYEEWLHKNITEEKSPRRREILEKGLPHGTVTLLQRGWYPAVGNFNHLYPEWEVRDLNNRIRYLDLGYMPRREKGCIEIQDFRSHARDVSAARFRDLCKKHSMLSMDGWILLQIAYLSIVEEPEYCRKAILAFIGKFISTDVSAELNWAEAETLRLARRLLRSFTPVELAHHLRISDRHARRVLHGLVERELLIVASGNKRFRTYQLR